MHQTQRNQEAQRLGGRTVSDSLVHDECILLLLASVTRFRDSALCDVTEVGSETQLVMWDLEVALPGEL